MNNKGFTLVELIAVVAILAIASGLIAVRFFRLTGEEEEFEYEVVAKDIAEAAYVFYDSKDNRENNKPDGTILLKGCVSAEELIKTGYISESQGLLKRYTLNDLRAIYYHAYFKDNEKKVDVYKTEDDCRKCLNPGSCQNENDPAIGHY